MNDRILAAHLAAVDAVIASTDRPVVTRARDALSAAESAIIEPGGFTVVPVAPPPVDPITAFVRAYPSSLPDWPNRLSARAVTEYTDEIRAEDYRAIRDAAVFAARRAIAAVIEHRSIDLVARPHMPPADRETLQRIVGSLVEDGIDAACSDWLWDYLPAPTA